MPQVLRDRRTVRAGRDIPGGERGVALLLVLWVLTVLMGIVFSFSYMTRTEAYATYSFKQGLEKKLLAEAGVERAVMEILYRNLNRRQEVSFEGTELLRPDGRVYRGALREGRYAFRVTDESGRIHLNGLTDESGVILKNLLLGLAVPADRADVIVDSILDWKDQDNLHRLNGAEDEYYQSLPVPYRAKNAVFDTLEELQQVRGVTPEILHGDGEHGGLVDYLTVHAGTAKINLAAAPREILMSLPGVSPAMAEKIVEHRRTLEIRSLEDVRAILGESYALVEKFIAAGDSNVFTIESWGYGDDEKKRHAVRATVRIDGAEQFSYLYYRSPAQIRP